MNKNILFIFILLLFSCGQKPEASSDTLKIKAVEIKHSSIPENTNTNSVQILIPGTYRDALMIDLSQLNSSWYELFFDKAERAWKIETVEYKTKRAYDECVGDSTTILSSAHNATLIFTGISINPKTFISIKPEAEMIPPNKTMKFTFRNKSYTLSAMGNVIESSGSYIPSAESAHLNTADFEDYKIENYMLSLSEEGGKSQLLFSLPDLKNGLVKLLWIGDLDNDGLPDFVFDTSANEEEKKVELFLSHSAQAEDYIKKAAEVWLIFDC